VEAEAALAREDAADDGAGGADPARILASSASHLSCWTSPAESSFVVRSSHSASPPAGACCRASREAGGPPPSRPCRPRPPNRPSPTADLVR
jgi:hypothetical protein